MTLLKRLWNWIVRKTSTAPTLAVVEEEATPVEIEEEVQNIGEIFHNICHAAGVRNRDIVSIDAPTLFEEWYTGPADEQSIRESIPDFVKEKGGAINAKLGRAFP